MLYLSLPSKVKTAQAASRKQANSGTAAKGKRISGTLSLSVLKAQGEVLASPKHVINMSVDSCGLSR